MRLELLLAHADDHSPVLDTGIPTNLVDAAKPGEGPALPATLRDDGADPNDLSRQRWGIIAPEGPEGDRLLGAIEPLSRARQEAQEGAPVRVYRVPKGMDPSAVVAWKRQVYWDESTSERDLPRYLLLLGDLDVMPLDLQQILGADTFVGRLAFSDEAGYQAYADKVLRWERHAATETQARALFYTVRDGTDATRIGDETLMAPCLARCRAESALGRFPAREIVAIEDRPPLAADALCAQARGAGPSLLFSMSHGLGAPLRGWRSADEQRKMQGAMRLVGGQRLTAADLTSKPFLPGGVWFFLACFGAGTPAKSVYHPWLSELHRAGVFTGSLDPVLKNLPRTGDRPFIAALPEAALRNPDGPLAFMGHIDLAFTYAFQDDDQEHRARSSRFQGIFRSLVDRARVGVAHHALLRFTAETAVELSTLYGMTRDKSAGEPPPDEARRAGLWLLQHDIAGYVLLGDPAVRLPLSAPRAPAAREELSSVAASLFGFAPQGEREAPKALDLDAMEKAALSLLSERDTAAALADRYGVKLDDLLRWAEVYRRAGRDALGKIRG
jgi:hypothetical protein